MKKLLVILMLFVSGVCFADTEYTYKKVDDTTLKIVGIETTKRINETNITIKSLKTEIANFEDAKVAALDYYNETISKLNEKIAIINVQIEKAIELGVIDATNVTQ